MESAGNPSEVLVADQLPLAQSPGKEEGGQTSVQLKAMAMNFQENVTLAMAVITILASIYFFNKPLLLSRASVYL
ncbi:small integral membrane protein 47 [Acinonyx jubatus]|uniref:Small integral membrane protein 47 n=2 Tax=Felinae TaxID=338152 RepID=A0ABM3P5N6_ACIJB|nr:small integral membrane protein 47 [Acinonyx jubatus]